MRVIILTNGEYGDYSFCKDIGAYEYVICADYGMHHATKLGIEPDIIVGDFDSISKEELLSFTNRGIKIIKFPPEKDMTDTEIAVQKAIELGANKIDIYGGIGSRLDHTLGNVQLLYGLLIKGIEARLLNPNNEVSITNSTICIDGEKGQLISLIPLFDNVEGVTTIGLAYSLDNDVLPIGRALGVSNFMLSSNAEVSVKKGTLLVIKARD